MPLGFNIGGLALKVGDNVAFVKVVFSRQPFLEKLGSIKRPMPPSNDILVLNFGFTDYKLVLTSDYQK